MSAWRWVERLQRSYTSILVDPHPVFVRDGKFFTSAGVPLSIDLSLAIAEEDYGHEVAKGLVIFVNRPGGQAQVSRALILQVHTVATLQEWSDSLRREFLLKFDSSRVEVPP